MEARVDKVVKVEDIAVQGLVHFDEENILEHNGRFSPHYTRSQSKSAHSHDDTNLGSQTDVDDHGEDTYTEITDTDAPMSLPAGWPQIPQLFVRQSWDFSTCMSPAINKATSHMELLQTIIEDWCATTEAEIRSRISSSVPTAAIKSRQPSSPSDQSTVATAAVAAADTVKERDQHTYIPPSSRLSRSSRVTIQPAVLVRKSIATPTLSIRGIGAKLEEGQSVQRLSVPTPEYEIPYLGAEEVIEEVITLLAFLENDRRETREALKEETKRVEQLQERIDMMCRKRLLELPDAVQKEHEACALDINELNWHVNYRSRVEARTQNKVDIAQALNERLEEDIAFVQKHVPLVQEKLELEKDAMDRIRQAQLDTNEELNTTVERCAKVEAKSEQAHNKAAAERAQIAGDIQAVKNELQQVTDELTQARATQNSYVAMQVDYNKQLADNKQEMLVMHIKQQNCMATEKMIETQVRDLQSKIVEEEYEHGRLDDDNHKQRKSRDTKRKDHARAEEEYQADIKHHETFIREIILKNKELSMEIQDQEEKIEDCKRQKIADEKNLVRMSKEMSRTDEQLKVTLDDYGKVVVINNAIRAKYNKEKIKCQKEEEQLKATSDTLMKRVVEEKHSRKVIQARMTSEDGELLNEQAEAKVIKQKMASKAQKIETAVNQILAKVEKLREAYAERTRIKNELLEKLASLKQAMKDLDAKFVSTKAELNPKIEKLKSSLTDLEKRLDYMEHYGEQMTKKIEDMDSYLAVISKVITKTDNEIQRLQENLDELNLQIDSGENLQDHLKVNINQCTARMRDMDSTHRLHLEDRKDLRRSQKRELENHIAESKRLASIYRTNQNKYVKLKNDLLNLYEEREQMEIAVKDLKKLQSLQRHLHNSLRMYYKLRGMYNKAELANMDAQAQADSNSVHRLQKEMDKALEDISVYLHQQMDPMAARRIAMARVAAGVDSISTSSPTRSAQAHTRTDTSTHTHTNKRLPPLAETTAATAAAESVAADTTGALSRQVTVSVTVH